MNQSVPASNCHALSHMHATCVSHIRSSDSFIMKVLFWLLLFGPVTCEESNETGESTDVVKLMEKYVLAADFDHNQVAQVQVSGDIQAEPKDGNPISFPNGNRHPEVYFPRQPDLATASGDSVDRDAFTPSDTLVISQRSVLAVGFLTFLILLNSLQSSVMNMAIMRNPAPASTSLLGGVTQALGRRRRRRTIK